MGDELSDGMNLGPISEPGSVNGETVNLAELMGEPARRIRGALRVWTRQRRRRQRRVVRIAPETRDISMANPGNVGSLQAGEGSGSAGERTMTINGDSSKRVDTEKGCDSDIRGFYDCSICFDLAKDPVVTLCGHLFCWPCIYRWLYEFSDAEECPVCKREAAIGNLTPIYGCGSSARELEEDPDLRIPARPNRPEIDITVRVKALEVELKRERQLAAEDRERFRQWETEIENQMKWVADTMKQHCPNLLNLLPSSDL